MNTKRASLEEIMEQVRRIDDEIHRLAKGAERSLRFKVGHRKGWEILVSQDPSKPERFRATTFDEKGEPFGHAEARTFIDAIYTARDLGALILPEIVNVREVLEAP